MSLKNSCIEPICILCIKTTSKVCRRRRGKERTRGPKVILREKASRQLCIEAPAFFLPGVVLCALFFFSLWRAFFFEVFSKNGATFFPRKGSLKHYISFMPFWEKNIWNNHGWVLLWCGRSSSQPTHQEGPTMHM